MAYTFGVVAWQGWDGRRYGGLPSNPQDARALKVLVTNPDNPGDTHQFWGYSSIHMQDFGEWWLLIGGLMVMHGMELADEPPDDDEDYGGPGEPDDDYDDEPDDDEPDLLPGPIRRVLNGIGRLFRRRR